MDLMLNGRVGPGAAGDGGEENLRQAKDLSLVACDGRGRFAEAGSRGAIYTGMTAVAGTTVVAANNTPVAAAAATILSLYNPLNSQYDLEVLKALIAFVSGTPAAGAWVYNVAYNQAITATPNNGGTAGARPINANGGQSGVGQIFTQTALTGGVGAQALYRPIGGAALFAGALAATTPGLAVQDFVDGEIVIPPGGLLSIASPGTGTTLVLAASLVWQENRRV